MVTVAQRRGDPAPAEVDYPSGRTFQYEWEAAIAGMQQQVDDLVASGGGSGSATHVYTQAVAASVWMIPHALGTKPNVLVVDGSGHQLMAEINYPSDLLVTVTHAVPYSGTAYLRA